MKKTLLFLSFGILSFTACNKKDNDTDKNLGNPDKALNSFIHQESAPIAAQWIYKKDLNGQWTGSFKMQQTDHFVHKINVNNDWEQSIDTKDHTYTFSAADFTTLGLNQLWDLEVWNENQENELNVFETAQRLEIEVDMDGLNYINPNHGFRIHFYSNIPTQPSNKSGEMEVVLYANDNSKGIHHFISIPVSANTTLLNIDPEMLIGFQQFNDVEIHVFQREMMYLQWFGKEALIQLVTAQVQKYAFSIY